MIVTYVAPVAAVLALSAFADATSVARVDTSRPVASVGLGCAILLVAAGTYGYDVVRYRQELRRELSGGGAAAAGEMRVVRRSGDAAGMAPRSGFVDKAALRFRDHRRFVRENYDWYWTRPLTAYIEMDGQAVLAVNLRLGTDWIPFTCRSLGNPAVAKHIERASDLFLYAAREYCV